MLITILFPTTCKLPTATEASIAGAVFRAASGLDARAAEREPLPDDPPDLLVAVPGPGDAAVWAKLLAADCPALVHLGCELPRIEAWARGLQGERDNRPCPSIWPWTPQARGHAIQWWVEARARRPPSDPPWHRVDLYPGTAWAFLWRDPGADPEGATGLAAAQHAASAVVAEWSENKTTRGT